MSSNDRELRARLEALQAERRHAEEVLAREAPIDELEMIDLHQEKQELEAAVSKLRFERAEIQSELRQTDRETNEALNLAKAWRKKKSGRADASPLRQLPFLEQLGDVLVAMGLVGIFFGTFIAIAYGVLVKLHGEAAPTLFGALVLAMPVAAIGLGIVALGKRRRERQRGE